VSATRLSALELRERYAKRELSPVEVVEEVLEQIERLNPALNAFVTPTPELAREQARSAEDAFRRSDTEGRPLLGIPYSVKDTIVTKGIRTTMGSRTLADWVPDVDAPAVERCREAGGVMLGKTNSPEFGWKGETTNALFGSTSNPWDLALTPGGSSGGAAAAVAGGMGPLALGTDAAGSLRIPAALSGVFAIKPSFGRVPVAPAGGIETLPHQGPITRTVRDAALLLDTIAGPDPRDRLSLPATGTSFLAELDGGVDGLRAAWSVDLGYSPVEPEIAALAEAAARAFEDLGCTVDEVALELDDPFEIVDVLIGAGAAGGHRDAYVQVRELLDPDRLSALERAFGYTAADVGAALARRGQFVEKLRAQLEAYDLLLTPTVPVPAFPVGLEAPPDVAGTPRPGLSWAAFSYPFNLTGQPAASVPCGFTEIGLPAGLQIAGRRHDDATVLRAAAAFEEHRPWAHLWPETTAAAGAV
jgi:aspartyl-tRNA(Asn)/glutamyl-tRNA(Gln) amidotransferase subunit A